MKKKRFIMIGIIVVILMVTMGLVGCSNFEIDDILADDLIDEANISASDQNNDIEKIRDNKASEWKTKKQGSEIEIVFTEAKAFNSIIIKEHTDSVKEFNIYIKDNSGAYQHLYKQDRIDEYRLCSFENVVSNSIKIVFDKFDKKLSIEDIGVYNLTSKNKNFKVNSYLNSSILSGTNTTQVQEGASDADYREQFKGLTDVTLLGNISLTVSGEINYSTGKENFIKDVEILKEINPNMDVHVTVLTGLVSNDFAGNNKAVVKLTKDEAIFSKAMANIGKMAVECNLDGIDYDWEYPQLAWEWSAYSKILINTKKAIGGRELSVALWPYGVNLSKEAMAAIDTVNIMAYDQFDKRGDHSSIFEMGFDAMEYFLGQGFSKGQLRLGIPFYGRTADKYGIWTNHDNNYGKWTNSKEDFSYVNKDNETVYSALFFNSYAMVRDKTALALAHDLGGIMIFSTNCDIKYSEEFSLHKAVNEVLENRIIL